MAPDLGNKRMHVAKLEALTKEEEEEEYLPGPNWRARKALPSLGLIGRVVGLLAFRLHPGGVPQNIIVLDSPGIKLIGLTIPRLRQWPRAESQESEGEHLHDGRAMESCCSLVAMANNPKRKERKKERKGNRGGVKRPSLNTKDSPPPDSEMPTHTPLTHGYLPST